MLSKTVEQAERADVPQALIRALFHQPGALETALGDAGLAPHDLAKWARRQGSAQEIEKLAGWLSVGQRPGYYKPLLEVAGSHMRAGDLPEAALIYRWAYRAWSMAPNRPAGYRYDGAKLLALWGECLYRLGQTDEAQQRWTWALSVVPDAETLDRLARTLEKVGAREVYQAVLAEARRRALPGSDRLWKRWERIQEQADGDHLHAAIDGTALIAAPAGFRSRMPPEGIAVMADVANLDMVCGEQYGFGRRLDYPRLLHAAQSHGRVIIKIAFVPDIPDTLAVRARLERAGFEIDLKRPKRSHGRMVANADTAMAAAAVRWATEPDVGRVELWTGDGDFLKVREVIAGAWPRVQVAFRSFEAGTAAGIRALEDWHPIDVQYVLDA